MYKNSLKKGCVHNASVLIIYCTKCIGVANSSVMKLIDERHNGE